MPTNKGTTLSKWYIVISFFKLCIVWLLWCLKVIYENAGIKKRALLKNTNGTLFFSLSRSNSSKWLVFSVFSSSVFSQKVGKQVHMRIWAAHFHSTRLTERRVNWLQFFSECSVVEFVQINKYILMRKHITTASVVVHNLARVACVTVRRQSILSTERWYRYN